MRGGKQIKNKKMLFLCIAVVLCAGFVVALLLYSENNQTNNAGSSLTVKCSNGGIFAGALEENTGVLSFKGIPYAKAPVGELRWKAPVEPDPVAGIIFAKYLRHITDKDKFYHSVMGISTVLLIGFCSALYFIGYDIQNFYILKDDIYYQQEFFHSTFTVLIILIELSLLYFATKKINGNTA